MEFGTIEREIYVEASPEIVFDVVSSPDHIKQWWPDEAQYEPVVGSVGELVVGDSNDGGHVAQFTVIDVRPPHTFTFRWTHPADEAAVTGNSLLVTFMLSAAEGGTLVTMTETGFRERGWDEAVVQETYLDHVSGWDFFLPRLAPYVAKVSVLP